MSSQQSLTAHHRRMYCIPNIDGPPFKGQQTFTNSFAYDEDDRDTVILIEQLISVNSKV